MRPATPEEVRLLVPILGLGIPTFFVFLWLVITSAIVGASGWGRLQKRFPARDDAPYLTLTRQTGSLGLSTFKSVLRLDACPLGLRVGMTRLIGPFHRSFEVPWGEISAEPGSFFHVERVRLHLGMPEAGTLSIPAAAWQQLSARKGS